jgi:ornithine cyclodeaminase/alanine dehydrogenase-like protein (mu-crystallin family)
VQLGIAGFGPIGQHHLAMCRALLGERLTKVRIFDIRPISKAVLRQAGDVEVVQGWEDAYADADLFITCTVSEKRYIDTSPKPGSLHLNVSLRDYNAAACHWFKGAIVVDDWEEVCRENTDIEIMHIQEGLQQTDTFSITDVVRRGCLMDIPVDQPVMFNPMGMAVFDIAISEFYYRTKRNGSVYEQTIKEGRC